MRLVLVTVQGRRRWLAHVRRWVHDRRFRYILGTMSKKHSNPQQSARSPRTDSSPVGANETPAPIIFLNGASSSGKTSIATHLQDLLGRPSIHLSEDAFFDMAMGARLGGSGEEQVYGVRVLLGLYRSIGTFAALGLAVIVDVVLEERAWLHECLEGLGEFDVLFVGIHCPLDELERRERARPDRTHVGLSRSHFDRVHAHGVYDLELDTSTTTPAAAAQLIIQALDRGRPFAAFARLRAAGY